MNNIGTKILAGLLLIVSPRLGASAAGTWSSQPEKAEKWHAVIFSDEGGNRFRLFYYGPELRKPCADEPTAFCAPLYELQEESPPSDPRSFGSRQTDFSLGLRGKAKKNRKLFIRRAGKAELPFKDMPYAMDKSLGMAKGAVVIVKPPVPATPAAPKEPELGAYENAVLDGLPADERRKYDGECPKQEPADGPGADSRRKSCRTAIGLALEEYGKSKVDADKLSKFETSYIEKRLGADARKFQRLIAKAGKGGKSEATVKAWRSAVLDEHTEYSAAAADKRHDHKPKKLEALLDDQFSKEFPLAAAIELVFKDTPTAERAMIEYLANMPFYASSRDKLHRAAKQMKPGDKPPADLEAQWREFTLNETRKRLEKDDPELAPFLAANGVKESEFWAHYCGLLVSAPSAAQGSRAGGTFAALKTAAKKSAQADSAPLGENASHAAAAAIEPQAAAQGGIAGRCQEAFNQAKLARLQDQPAASGKKGSEVEPPQPVGKDAGGSKEKKDDPNKNVNMIGGAKMGVWSGWVAAALGGPVGWAMLLGVGGLALGAWMTKDINR